MQESTRREPIEEPVSNRLLLTVAETCRLLSLSRTTVFHLRRQGVLDERFVGGAVRVTYESVRRLAGGR